MTMNMPKMFPPGKASVPMIDHNTAHIKTTISPRVSTRPKNPDGGMVAPAEISLFLNFPVLDFEGESPLFASSSRSPAVSVSMINKRIEENPNWS